MKLKHLLLLLGQLAVAALALAPLHATANPIDTDNDGVLDDADYCPQTPGTVWNHGCPAQADLTFVRDSYNGDFSDVVCPGGEVRPHWVNCPAFYHSPGAMHLVHFAPNGDWIRTERLIADGPCGDGSSDADCTCTAGQTKYQRDSDGLHVCVTPPPFADVCTAYLKGHGFTQDDARPVCEYFVGDGTFPLPSWALDLPELWHLNLQIAMSCAMADKVDYMLGVGGFTVAGLKGITARNFYEIGKITLGKAALRFSGIASVVGLSGSTISEVCELAGY